MPAAQNRKLFCPQEANEMKKQPKQTSRQRTTAKAGSPVRVIRISEEAWAAKCMSVASDSRPAEAAEFFDRALRLGPRTRAS